VQAFFSPIPNPVRIAEDAREFIDPHLIPRVQDNVFVHLGFREYLYGNTKGLNLIQFVKKIQAASSASFQNLIQASGGLATKATNAFVPESVSKGTGAALTKAYDVLVPGFMKKKSQKDSETENDTTDMEGGESVGIEIAANEKKTVTSGGIEVTDEVKQRYQVILEMVSVVLKENPGYSLYVCGHSLGGALATMFGKYTLSWYLHRFCWL